MRIWEAIKIQSLRTVLRPDDDYNVRSVMRWYSREFNTPLGEVYDLPIEEVLRDYFECEYEKMEPHELEEEREYLLSSEAEREQMRQDSEDEEAAAARFYEEALKEAEEAESQEGVTPAATDDTRRQNMAQAPSAVPTPILPLPEISMKFDESNLSEEEFEARFNPTNAIRKR